MQELVVVTRSVNDALYDLSGELLDPEIPRIKLQGTAADNYFYAFNDIDAEWIINLDEDAFVLNWPRILGLLEYMKSNDYDFCGVPDGGVIDHRFHNPISPNPFFSIHNNKKIREKFDLAEIEKTEFAEDLKQYTPTHLLKENHKFAFDNFEPYYSYFFWLLRSGSKCLYLDAESWQRDPVTSVVLDTEQKPLLLHTWFARDFDNQRWRFELAANYCKSIRENTQELSPPLVTIGILTHNRREFLEEAIESALAQETEAEFEVLVLDNGSQDETTSYLASIEDARVRSIRFESNEEKSAGRNAIIQNMKGEFVLWLDDDDVLLPQALASHHAVLKENPDADVIYGQLYACDAELTVKGEMKYPQRNPSDTLRSLLFFSPFPNGGTMVRKRVFETVGGYETSLTRAEDYDLWVRAAAAHCAFVQNENFIYKYRDHAGNAQVGERAPEFAKANAFVLTRHLERQSLRALFPMFNWDNHEKGVKAHVFSLIAARYLHYGELARAKKYVQDSLSLNPSPAALVVDSLIQKRMGNFDLAYRRLLQSAAANKDLRELLEIAGVR